MDFSAALLAQQEAGQRQTRDVGAIELLLGLLRENDSVAACVLQVLTVDTEALREAAAAIPITNPQPGSDFQLTPGGKRVIDLAYDEARQLKNNYIGTEHLLLGVCRDEREGAGRVMASAGITIEALRGAVRQFQDDARAEGDARAKQAYEAHTALLAGIVRAARALAHRTGSMETLPSHLLLAVVQCGTGAARRLLDRLGADIKPLIDQLGGAVDLAAVEGDLSPLAQSSQAVLAEAANSARKYFAEPTTASDHLLLALMTADAGTEAQLKSLGLTPEKIVTEIRRMRDEEA